MVNLYAKDRLKLLDKVKIIDCSKENCEVCAGRSDCYKLRQISKYWW